MSGGDSEAGAGRMRGGGGGLTIGLVYEHFDTYAPREGEPSDAHVEYEPPATVEALEAAITLLGHRPARLGSPRDLLAGMASGAAPDVDVALNIAEGQGSRNREAWAPVLLDMAGIAQLGSDALTLSLTLDKAWALRMAAAAGIRVAPHCVCGSREQALNAPLPADFPLFVKPRWEGTSKGIRASSRVEDRGALADEVARIVRDYDQPALVEAFLSGAEFTVTVIGHAPPRALPVLQRALEAGSRIGLHALEGVHAPAACDPGPALAYALPGQLDAPLEAELAALALRAHALFECLDYSRCDFRLDGAGRPTFLEINPLPTFSPSGSFGILAELAGRPLESLLAEVIGGGLERLALVEASGGVARGAQGPG